MSASAPGVDEVLAGLPGWGAIESTEVEREDPVVERDVLAVVNAAAGSARARQVHAAMTVLRAATSAAGGHAELVATADVAHLSRALGRLAGRQLVVLGGDGSIHAAVQCLRDRDRLHEAGPIGIVPLGTGNDLARSLGLPLDAADAARVVMTGRPRAVDLLVADDRQVAVNAVHAGIGAAAGAWAAAVKPRLGVVGLGGLAYPLGALLAGATERGWPLRVRVDGGLLHDGRAPVLMVAIGTAGTVGGGAPLLPRADPHDGLVDVVVSLAVGPLARAVHALQIPRGSHVRRADVRTARARVVELEAPPGVSFSEDIDGEVRGPCTARSWQVEPAAWQVLTPRSRT